LAQSAKIIFLCSGVLHAKLYRPFLTEEIKKISIIYTLDYYNLTTTVTAFSEIEKSNTGVRCLKLKLYRYFSTPILNQIHMLCVAKKVFQAVLKVEEPSLLVLGNDTGAPERIVIRLARKLSIKTLLVQDGFIFPASDDNNSILSRLGQKCTLLYSETIGKYLGMLSYGSGGCTVIASTSDFWKLEFEKIKVKYTKKISVVGNSLLENLSDKPYALPMNFYDNYIVFFTTNFISGFGDYNEHQNQIRVIEQIRLVIPESTQLIVQLHPHDEKKFYSMFDELDGIDIVQMKELKELVKGSWICLTNISSVITTCLSLGRVCYCMGFGLSGGKYINLLKRISDNCIWSIDDLCIILSELSDFDHYIDILELKREEVLGQCDDKSNRISAVKRMTNLLLSNSCMERGL
jgi:hypothetical protein